MGAGEGSCSNLPRTDPEIPVNQTSSEYSRGGWQTGVLRQPVMYAIIIYPYSLLSLTVPMEFLAAQKRVIHVVPTSGTTPGSHCGLKSLKSLDCPVSGRYT